MAYVSLPSPPSDRAHLHPQIQVQVEQPEENPHENSNQLNQPDLSNRETKNKQNYMILVVVNYMCLFIGSVSSSLLSKFYFNHKGGSRWVSTLVQCAGFPLLILPIYLPYFLFKSTKRKPFSGFSLIIFGLSAIIGLLLGLNNYLFSWANSYLPVSTFSLLLSTQLVFILLFSLIIVKQKITFSNLNSVILITLSSVLLALGSNHDKPLGLTRGKYFLGYLYAIGAGLMFSLYLPIMEKIYSKVYCYSMVMEMQLVMEIFATCFALVGMTFGSGFKEMRDEIYVFDLGPKIYWVTIIFNIITWQLSFMGTAGMVFLTTSVTGGICMTAILAINVLGGVVVYGDEFGGIKIVSTLMCLWGFLSYIYGMYMKSKEKERLVNGDVRMTEMAEILRNS